MRRPLPLSLLLLIVALAMPFAALAHHAAITAPTAPPPSVAVARYSGVVESVVVEDRLLGASERHYALRLDDGTALALRDVGDRALADGTAAIVAGRRNGDHLFVTGIEPAAGAVAARVGDAKALAQAETTESDEGELELLNADDFAAGRCDLVLSLLHSDGSRRPLRVATLPPSLEPGMKLRAHGHRASGDGVGTLVASRIEILAWAPDTQTATTSSTPKAIDTKAARTSTVLVMLLKFSDTPLTDAFVTNTTPASVNNTMFVASTGVAAYYREVSYNSHLLSGAVTSWLTARFARPATCDYSSIATEAQALAQLAGYNPANYEKKVFIFPSLPACGWSGLGGGSTAWINGTTMLLVIGHELGHTFGLGHASSIGCNGLAIAPNCAKSEYGDTLEIMGNTRTMHFDAPHKADLGYLPQGTVRTHTTGTATYTIQPLESPGASTYAVKVEASPTRSYWLEFRQPIGFDAPVAQLPVVANGALIHLGWPNDYGCDTCLLDMTPGTASLSDAALEVGRSFVDGDTGTTITAVSAGTSGVTVTVVRPPTSSHVALYRPSTSTFFVDYQFDHAPDLRTVFGAPGDVPVAGRFGSDGLMSFAVYRNGAWYFDTNRDGAMDSRVGFGGAPGDVPLAAPISTAYRDDLIIYRRGIWYVDFASSRDGRPDRTYVFGGNAVDIPLAGDINGDGIADLVIYRNGVWYIDTNRDGTPDSIVRFGGAPGDVPALMDWDGDGRMDLVIYRGGIWYVTTDLSGRVAAQFNYGTVGDRPLTGGFYR